MRLARSVFFCEPGPHGDMYRRLARVHEYTAKKHCAGWDVSVDEIPDPGRGPIEARQSFVWNTEKLREWRAFVLTADDGDELLLADADTAVLRPLDPVWDHSFDVAYTVRERGLPLNGGIVFVRVSAASRQFFDAWWDANLLLFNDPVEHAPWRSKYAGMNQASFGYVLEKVDHDAKLIKLPCQEWNCVQWTGFDQGTRVLHVKSGLRRATFGLLKKEERPRPHAQRLIALWHKLEKEALAHG